MQKKAVGVGVQLLKINVIIYFLGVALRELFAILAEPTSDWPHPAGWHLHPTETWADGPQGVHLPHRACCLLFLEGINPASLKKISSEIKRTNYTSSHCWNPGFGLSAVIS